MKRQLECCCCGEPAGRWHQWHNRDDGYGVCAKCIDWMRTRPRKNEADRETPEELVRNYGHEGLHWGRDDGRYTTEGGDRDERLRTTD